MMRWKIPVMLLLAVLCGAGAMVAAGYWAQGVRRERPVAAVAEAPKPALGTIVVAASPLRYGTEVTAKQLREIPWPAESLPPGAFKTVSDVLAGSVKRVALAAMDPNEPVLAAKVTGPGQRGTLSTLLDEGMGAVTVPVNEIVGVAGFVQPGDRVDILLTRRERAAAEAAAAQAGAYSDVVLQNVKVLAIGQLADERAEKPAVVSAVTLEVDQVSGQKLSLAAASGSLALMLRKAGDVEARSGKRVSVADIGQQTTVDAVKPDNRIVTVRVTRGMKPDEYAVPKMANPSTLGPNGQLASVR
jgi:pilus assembly protein CpaB